MKLLIVSATEAEIAPLLSKFPGLAALRPQARASDPRGERSPEERPQGKGTVEVLISGVGTPATVYHLTKVLQKNRYDLVINAGIAGSFDRGLPPGTLVQVVSDGFADLGAEDGDAFLDVFQLGLAGAETAPFKNGRLLNAFRLPALKEVSGITVNTVHGNEARIEAARSRFPAVTESMEGAGFFYVCMSEEVQCLQLRAVSNFVEKRNRENWNIPLAVKNLNAALAEIIKRYSSE